LNIQDFSSVRYLRGRICSTHGYRKNEFWILAEKPEGKRPLRRSKHRWKSNIKIDVREIRWGGMDRNNVA
jgi:hypothetical protein